MWPCRASRRRPVPTARRRPRRRPQAALSALALERRLLLSTVERVADLSSVGSSTPQSLTTLGNLLFFSADDGVHGRELWRHDPATGATTLVADIQPGAGSSLVSSSRPFATLDGSLYMVADDGTHGRELWRHDPAANTTTLVADIRAGSANADIAGAVGLGGRLYFAANDGMAGAELWRYDPASGAASLVVDLRAGAAGSSPSQLTALGGRLYFAANDGVTGNELWQHDPATGATTLIHDANPGGLSGSPASLTGIDGSLYYAATSAATGQELYRYDPTAGTTEIVADVAPGAAGSTPTRPTSAAGSVFFYADDGTTGRELYWYDLASIAATRVSDFSPTLAFQVFAEAPVVFDGRLYFNADDGQRGQELWRHDPATGATTLVADICATAGVGSMPFQLTVLDGQLYFQANDGTGTELWRHDPATDLTELVADLAPVGSVPDSLTVLGEALYFDADDWVVGRELWKFTPTPRPVVSFDSSSQEVAESAGTVTVGFVLDRPAPTELRVPVQVSKSTGSPDDYVLESGEVVFAAGTTEATISFTVVDDALNEDREVFTLTLGPADGVRLGAETSHIVAVLDDDPLPALSFTTARQQAPEGEGPYTVTVRLSAASGRDVKLALGAIGSAKFGIDYTLPTSITIPAGETESSVAVEVVDDSDFESNEFVTLSLSKFENALRATGPGLALTHTLTIPTSDAPTVDFTVTQWDFSEDNDPNTPSTDETRYTLKARLSHAIPETVTVPLVIDTAQSTADSPDDFTLSLPSIVIPGGFHEGFITITARNDEVFEPIERFLISMGEVRNALPGATTSFSGRILANDKPTISFDSTSSAVWEDDGANGLTLNISASLTKPSSVPINVPVRVISRSLTTTDYEFTDSTFTFPGDSTTTTATVTLTTKMDRKNEPNERIELAFQTTGLVNISGTRSNHKVTIQDNDPYVSFVPFQYHIDRFGSLIVRAQSDSDFAAPKSLAPEATTASLDVSEGDGDVTARVYLSAPSNLPVKVPLKYSGTATAGTDYKSADTLVTIPASSGRLSDINPGVTGAEIEYTIVQNTTFEADQYFRATINTAKLTNAAGVAKPGSLTVTIEDDDQPAVSFVTKSQKVGEASGKFTVTLRLSRTSEVDVAVPIRILSYTSATLNSDYTLSRPVNNSRFTVTIPANTTTRPTATFTINVINDTDYNEADIESISLQLGKPSGVTLGERDGLLLRITDDDVPPGNYNPIDFLPPEVIQPLDGGLIHYGAGQVALVTQGYVAGSFVFFDANKNGVHDFLDLDGDGTQGPDEPSEVSAETQPNGRFLIVIPEAFDLNGDGVVNPDEGQLVAVGGIDSATGLPLTGSIVAPGGSAVVSPFTTLMSVLVEGHGMTLDEASSRVHEALGLPDEVDLTRFDPIAATLEGSADGAAVFAADSKLTSTVAQLASLASGALAGAPPAFLMQAAYADIAAKIVEEGSRIDLAAPEVVAGVIRGVAFGTGLALDEATVRAAAEVIAAGNRHVDEVEPTPDESFLMAMSKAQIVAQGVVAERLAELGAGAAAPADVLASSTGQALADLIDATPAADVIPTSLTITDATQVETDGGAVAFEFTVTPDRASTRAVSVRYETADSTASASAGDYTPEAGVLVWDPGDVSPRTVRVRVHGDADFEADEAFLVLLSHAENALPARRIGVGTIANDDDFVFHAPAGNAETRIALAIEGGLVTLSLDDDPIFAGELSAPVPITIVGADGSANHLTLDLADAGAFLAAGITFRGGDGNDDRLTVREASASIVAHILSSPGSGTITIDDAAITYEGVESVTDLIAAGIEGVASPVPEGSTLAFDARPADPESTSAWAFTWSLARDGHLHTEGVGTSFAALAGADGLYTLTLTATNLENEAVGTTIRTFAVENAPPAIASLTIGDPGQEGTPIDMVAEATDPGDAVESLTYAWEVFRGLIRVDSAAGIGRSTFRFTPDDDGPYRIVVTVSDEDGQSVSAERSIDVANAAPTAGGDSVRTDEDAPVTFVVLDNDTDPAGARDPLVVAAVTDGAYGTVSINPDGTLTYQPHANYSGQDTFSYTIADGDGGFDIATVVVVVNNLVDVAGVVFDDLDNNGVRDAGEAGIEGVTVELFDAAGSRLAVATTDAGGQYAFDANLGPGTYRIIETQPAGRLDGRESAGNLGGSVDNGRDSDAIADLVVGEPGITDDAVDYLFAELRPSDLFGLVWRDFNDDGEVNFGEMGIDGVTVTLQGLDDRGNFVQRSASTTLGGLYGFINLRPGTYEVIESQPTDSDDGRESLGSVTDPGVPTAVADRGMIGGDDRFTAIRLVPGTVADRYNFGERPRHGEAPDAGSTAPLGFWHNKHGQALIHSLNGGPAATRLGDWLAATFPAMYGPGAVYDADSGPDRDMSLAGKSNPYVAETMVYLFQRNGRNAAAGGPPKVDAQVLATALSTYVTSEALSGGNFAAGYGFTTTADGIAYRTFRVLDVLTTQEAADLGIATDADGRVAILAILQATDAMARQGLLCDADGNGVIDADERRLRELANRLFSAINEG